jgi:hypothetical protein
MDFHLEHEVRLNTEPEHKSLYKWSIVEVDAKSQKTSRDYVPWQWNLFFSATSLVLSDNIDISRPFKFQSRDIAPEDDKETVRHGQSIRIQLASGDTRRVRERSPAYSMFGTNRGIETFELHIYPLDNPDEQERFGVWGCPSYTTEIDFRDDTSNDCITFNLWVKPETFAGYVTKIANWQVDEMVLRVGHVDGFYSEWTPGISTDHVKVLTADKAHKITAPSDTQLAPPRLGRVREAQLFINRLLEFHPKDEEQR